MENKIKKNQLFIITSGDAYDFSNQGVFRAKRDIDLFKVKERFLTQIPENKEFFNEFEFITWLIKLEIIEKINLPHWHLGEDGNGKFELYQEENLMKIKRIVIYKMEMNPEEFKTLKKLLGKLSEKKVKEMGISKEEAEVLNKTYLEMSNDQ